MERRSATRSSQAKRTHNQLELDVEPELDVELEPLEPRRRTAMAMIEYIESLRYLNACSP